MCKLSINSEKERKKGKECQRKDNELDVATPLTILPTLKYVWRVHAAAEVKWEDSETSAPVFQF